MKKSKYNQGIFGQIKSNVANTFESIANIFKIK